MTEHIANNHPVLEWLASSMEDPAVANVFTQAREYTALIKEVDATTEDCEEIINALNEMWPYHRNTLTITGNVWLPSAVGQEVVLHNIARS